MLFGSFRTRLHADIVRLREDVRLLLEKVTTMSNALDTLTADVAAQNNVVQSAVTLISGLSAQISAAVAGGDTAALTTLSQQLEANTAALANAVTANTPAAPSPASGATGATGATGPTGATGA